MSGWDDPLLRAALAMASSDDGPRLETDAERTAFRFGVEMGLSAARSIVRIWPNDPERVIRELEGFWERVEKSRRTGTDNGDICSNGSDP